MSYTATGAHRRAARRLGIPEEEYLAQIALGNRRCGVCRQWLKATEHFRKRSLGSPYYHGWCRGCRVDAERRRRKRLAA